MNNVERRFRGAIVRKETAVHRLVAYILHRESHGDNVGDNSEKAAKPEKRGDTEKDKSKPDWVTARSSCSIPKVFKELRSQVEEDVKTRNALRPNNSPYEFSVTEHDVNFAVLLATKEAHESVVFTIAEHAISVRDDQGKQILEVTLTFNDQGECKLSVNQQERELWQVRRMALEEIFFRGS